LHYVCSVPSVKSAAAADASQGARARLASLYASELPAVYGFLKRMGANRKDLEDLAHDVFVTALRRWSSYDPGRPVRPWILGITFRVMSDHRKRAVHVREVVGAELEAVPDERQEAVQRVVERESRELLQRALEEIPSERRAALILYELQGLNAEEVSEVMGVPRPTTFSRLRVGREELARAVKRIEGVRGDHE
jgi:RNA polymerase sigma-70 factor, ECF subfamily